MWTGTSNTKPKLVFPKSVQWQQGHLSGNKDTEHQILVSKLHCLIKRAKVDRYWEEKSTKWVSDIL